MNKIIDDELLDPSELARASATADLEWCRHAARRLFKAFLGTCVCTMMMNYSCAFTNTTAALTILACFSPFAIMSLVTALLREHMGWYIQHRLEQLKNRTRSYIETARIIEQRLNGSFVESIEPICARRQELMRLRFEVEERERCFRQTDKKNYTVSRYAQLLNEFTTRIKRLTEEIDILTTAIQERHEQSVTIKKECSALRAVALLIETDDIIAADHEDETLREKIASDHAQFNNVSCELNMLITQTINTQATLLPEREPSVKEIIVEVDPPSDE